MKSRLLKNIVSLATIKGLQYVIAFITFPYLVRVLQAERYGAIVFTQSVVYYFQLLTDYGFNLVGPREIARFDNVNERRKVFGSIFFAKLLLLGGSIIILGITVLTISNFRIVDIKLFMVEFLMVIGNVIFPVWFFQGIQEMYHITIANFLARVLSLIGILCFVHTSEDYLIAALCQSIVPLIAGFYSWIIICNKYKKLLYVPKIEEVKEALISGWTVFTSTVAINIYTASNVVFLGIFTNNVVVGYFSGAKKIIDTVSQMYYPVTQAIYPYVSRKVAESKLEAIRFLKKIVLFIGTSTFVLSLIIFSFAPFIIECLMGAGFEESVIILRIIAFLPFIIALSQVFGVQTMLNFNMQKEFSQVLILASIVNVCMVVPLICLLDGIGVAISVTITESLVTLLMWWKLKKNNINLL